MDHPRPGTYEIAAGDVDWQFIPLEAAAKMRASFILLGPLLARFGRVIISNPGGDRIGRRPVNLHVDAMRALGAEIDYRNGYYYAQAPGRLRGGEVDLPHVTVMGTENAMLAATLADGHTVIRPAAQEPEVDDLIEFLRKMGARVQRTAPDTIEVDGRRRLRGRRPLRDPRPDRDRHVPRRRRRHRRQAHPRERRLRPRRRAGRDGRAGRRPGRLRPRPDRDRRDRLGEGACRACDIETAPYPGLATDVQPPTCVLLTQAAARAASTRPSSRTASSGWPSCASWAPVDIEDAHHADIHGPARLHGAEVDISDLRAGASLILAALAADGTSLIHGAHHVQRGYENIDRKFQELGARIERLPEQVE